MTTIEQQIQELTADIDEIKQLVEQSTRSRVKQALELQQRRFETDLINLKDKQEKATAATEKKPTATASSTANRTYTKEITGYAWDQLDKVVKIYLEGLEGVADLPAEQVHCSFETAGFTLEVKNLKNVNYVFKRTRLLHDIKPEQSTYKVGKNRVILSLAKAEPKNWECLLRDEKKTPEKPVPKMDESKNPGDSLMEMMKNMYETGDDEMKRTIAKAWTESREKMNTGGGGAGGDDLGMPGF